MSDENVLEEFAAVDRRIWEAGGGTVHGFMEYCRRFAEEDHPKFVAENERRKAEGTWKSPLDEDWEKPAWAHSEVAGEAMVVREGDAPCYQTVERSNGQTVERSNGGTDLARKGAEGDAR